MSIYCRILQWCERAKVNALLMHGVEKSTFKGIPPKKGALVGTSVLVDGFSKKPANSIPYALVRKPPIPPGDMVFAVAVTKRKLKAMRKRPTPSRIVSGRSSMGSVVSRNRRERIFSSGTITSSSSSVFFDKFSVSEDLKRIKTQFVYEKELRNAGNIRNPSKLNGKQNVKKGDQANTKSVKSISQLGAIAETKRVKNKDREFFSSYASSSKFPDYNDIARKTFRLSFKPKSNTKHFQSFAAIHPQNYPPPPAVKRLPPPFSLVVSESGIPLPPKRVESQLKPFFYWSSCEKVKNPVDETLEKFQYYRGATPHQNAVQCLTIASSFTEKPWLQQLRMAVSLTKRGVKKNQNFQHSLSVNA